MDLTIWSRGGISPFYNFTTHPDLSKLSPTFDRPIVYGVNWSSDLVPVVTLGNGVPRPIFAFEQRFVLWAC